MKHLAQLVPVIRRSRRNIKSANQQVDLTYLNSLASSFEPFGKGDHTNGLVVSNDGHL